MSVLRPPSAEVEHIAVSRTKGVRIDWKDGHHSEYSLPWLRSHCPCATCTGAHGDSAAPEPASPFPMYKPALKLEDVQPVGSYAIQLRWNDGHSTGIFSFDYLRRICPCPACARAEDYLTEVGN